MQETLERIYPDDPQASKLDGAQSIKYHLDRYQFAMEFLKPGLVADRACGSGYGSKMLACTTSTVIAVDSDQEAINYASSHYSHPSVTFLCADALNFSWDHRFQSVVSLETIEHLEDPKTFVKHMSEMLAPGGRFIASAPVTPSMDANPFHLNDYTSKSFRKLFLDCGLKETVSKLQIQPYSFFKVTANASSRKTRANLISYYFKNPIKFLLRLKSIFKDGFRNKYLLVVFEKNRDEPPLA